MNTQAVSQDQSGDCFLDRQNLMSCSHPEDVAKFCLPNSGRTRFSDCRHERSNLVNVLVGAEQQVRYYIRIDNSFHERPVAIQVSISLAVGRRA
jgi:hypothetical protein